MRERGLGRLGWCLSAAAGLMLGSSVIVSPAFAQDSHERCPPSQVLASLDEKVCPPNPDRPAIVVKRACCENPAGKVHCKPFPHCPKKSPS